MPTGYTVRMRAGRTSSNGSSTPPPVSGGDRATIGAGRTAPHSSKRMIQPDPRSLVPSIYENTAAFASSCSTATQRRSTGESARPAALINARCVYRRIAQLLDQNAPDVLVIQDTCEREARSGRNDCKYSAAATQTLDERRSSNGVLRCRAAPALTYFRRKRLDECTR